MGGRPRLHLGCRRGAVPAAAIRAHAVDEPHALLQKIPIEGVIHRGVTDLAIGVLGKASVHRRRESLDGVKSAMVCFHEVAIELLKSHGRAVGGYTATNDAS